MSAYGALVPPRPWVIEKPGLCLRYAQSFFGAPAMYRSARDAFDATKFKHAPSQPLPDVPVLLWFDHWGAYNDGLGPYRGVPVGGVANWGHVTPYIPGKGIYSSPANPNAGYSFDVYSSIAQVERAFNAKYIGWTEDINGLRVAEPITQYETEDDQMIVYYAHAYGKNKPGWLVLGFTPKALVLSTESSAKDWAEKKKLPTIKTNYSGFIRYLTSANCTVAQRTRVSKG